MQYKIIQRVMITSYAISTIYPPGVAAVY